MKKIGLVMCYKTRNYGSMLQSFALQQYFVRKEIPFECVNYIHKKDLLDSVKKLPLLLIKSARMMKFRVMKSRLVMKFFVQQDLKKLLLARIQKFEDFSKKRFVVTEEINSRERLIQLSQSYKSVIVGSDQVWHPINFGTHFYDLSWVDESVPKYAYASSFGVSKIPFLIRSGVSKALKSFDKISCREKTGSDIVYNLIGKKAETLPDPTLLWSADEWNKMLDLDNLRTKKEPYVFCYFLGNSPECYDFANKLKKITGLKIIAPILLDGYYPETLNFGDEHPFDVGPADFVWFIKNADFVCTDSFHGTVFSLLFQKKVAIFNRYKQKSSASANSRIYDLFNLLGIKRNIWENAEKFSVSKPYDIKEFETALATARQKSFNYLQGITGEN